MARLARSGPFGATTCGREQVERLDDSKGDDDRGTGIWYNCGDMKVEDTELLAALKRGQKDQQRDIPDEEKVKVADEVHEWLKGKQGAKAEE